LVQLARPECAQRRWDDLIAKTGLGGDYCEMTLLLFIEQLINGLQFGLMLFLMAVGVTLVFGVMRVINLAHGSMFMVGGYFLVAAYSATRSYALALPLAITGVVAVAVVMELLILRPLYRRGPLDQVLATFGMTMFFNESVVVIWGREPLDFAIPPLLDGYVQILPGISYPVFRLTITGVAIVVGFLYTLVFALGAALAGLAGMMTGPLLSVEPGIGDPILILTLVVIVIGGVGSIRGALAGALIVGVFDTFSRVLVPQLFGLSASSALTSMAVYILMAAVLIYSQTGLFTPQRG
jgi:branched-chain amino acid transport system permease protein